MRFRIVMEENRDTLGWGIVGTVWAMMSVTPDLTEKLMTAALVAGCGWLGSYIVKKIAFYLEGRFVRWRENRKTKKLDNPTT